MGRLVIVLVIGMVLWCIAYMHKNSTKADIEHEKAFWNRNNHDDNDRIEELEQEVAELKAKLNSDEQSDK